MPDRTGPKVLSVGVGKALDSLDVGEVSETRKLGWRGEEADADGVASEETEWGVVAGLAVK